MKRIERRIAALLLVLAFAGGLAACSGPEYATGRLASPTAGDGAAMSSTSTPGVVPSATVPAPPTRTAAPSPSATTASPPTATATTTPTPTETATTTSSPVTTGGLLPNKRIVAFYGHPSSGRMGILGASSKEEALRKLREQGAAYEAADPSRPVQLAFELIATVAQPYPGEDGTYVAYTGDAWIGEYVDFATQNGLVVILDVQIGWSTIAAEIERIRPWLERPNVFLAIDPEFSTGPNRVPGTFIGEVDGAKVQSGLETISQIVRDKGLPPKVVIVHQFESDMILNKQLIKPLPGVDVVIDMDGFGTPEAKIGNYNYFVRDQLVQYGGIKLFYKQDDPLLTPEQVVALDPPPLVVIYQ